MKKIIVILLGILIIPASVSAASFIKSMSASPRQVNSGGVSTVTFKAKSNFSSYKVTLTCPSGVTTMAQIGTGIECGSHFKEVLSTPTTEIKVPVAIYNTSKSVKTVKVTISIYKEADYGDSMGSKVTSIKVRGVKKGSGGTTATLLRGLDTAPVTLETWIDYKSPYVTQFESTLQRVLSDYFGTVNNSIRFFPIEAIYPGTSKMAEAVACVNAQHPGEGDWYLMHIHILQNPDATVTSIKNFVNTSYGRPLDKKRFATCLDSGEMAPMIARDLKEGYEKNVTGVPQTFVIRKSDNKTMLIQGAQPYDSVAALLNQFLDSNQSHLLTLISPNGGEIMQAPLQLSAKWKYTGQTDSNANFPKFAVEIVNEKGQKIKHAAHLMDNKTRTIVPWSETNSYGFPLWGGLPKGKYKLVVSVCPGNGDPSVCLASNLSGQISDTSEGFFTVR